MTAKRAKELASIQWVQEESRKLTEKRAASMAAFVTQELEYTLAQRQKPGPLDANSIENIIDRAWDHVGGLPVPREAVAFEVWNGLHLRGVEITHMDKCRYVPKMEGGAAPSRLREAFRAWYEW